ncbi:uncharacterized protein LOC144663792 [Oculina patagonica]
MDNLFKLALSSQTICGGIQFLLFFISLGAVIGALQHYHANDRLTFNCSPKPSDFFKQLCYNKYTTSVSPWLIPRNVAAITYGVLCVCWICFMLYGAVTLRQIKREQAEQNQRRRQWRRFLCVYIIHVSFRLLFLSVMTGIFCSNQTLDLPSVFKCSTFFPQTNTTRVAVNQTETLIQCNDLHYKEKSNINIAIIVIQASIIILGVSELIHLILTREKFHEKLLGDVFEVASNLDMENVLENIAATENNLQAVSAFTTALKPSIRSQTEFQPKLMASPTISNPRTDDIFTNLLIQHGRKALYKKDMTSARGELLNYYGQVSGTRVRSCEEIFVCSTEGEPYPKSILVTGKAGIGKTLFCQKLVRDWADDKLFQSQAILKTPDIKFAYLLTFRQLNLLGNDRFSLRELLNCSSILDENSNIDNLLFEYLVNHPEEVLIILDGYDEYSQQDYIAGNWEEQYPNNASVEMAVAALCAKLIKGKIFRDSVVMITSRPDESDKMGGIQFDQYVEITGFSPEQVKEYIEKYFRANETMRNTVLEHVMNNENLVSFAHIPVLCFLMCFYLEYTLQESKSRDLPVSATDIYSNVVNIFELKHNAESEYKTKEIPEKHKASDVVESTLDKLSELAAQLLLQQRPIFNERDIEEKFNSEEIEKLKGSGLLHSGPPFRKSAFETTKQLSFTHLTIQEFLAARWFVMRNEIPEENVSEMVMLFIAGILSKKRDDKLMERLLERTRPPLLLKAKLLSEYQDKEFAKKVTKNHHASRYVYYRGRMIFEDLNDVDCIAISFLLDVISELNEEEAATAQHERSEQSYCVNSLEMCHSALSLCGIKRICESLEKEHCAITKLFLNLRRSHYSDTVIIRLCKVTTLDLSSNKLTDTGVARLCEALQHSSCKVTALHLSLNQITDTGVSWLCEALQHSSCKVTTLDLSRNQITDTGVTWLCEALQHSSCKVTTLDLSYNQITDTGVASLCEALQHSSCKVTTLDLSGNQITDTGVTWLCEALQHPSCKVTTLDLSDNQITDIGVANLCKALQHPSCKVTTLNLSGNQITDTGVARLCEALQHKSCKVTTLNLSGNQITDTGVARLCEALQHPSCKVNTLNLSDNQITDTGVARLCEALQHPSCKVNTLDLSGNQITDTGVARLCEALQHISCKVTTLYLIGNQITDTGVPRLCEALQDPSCKVNTLALSYNQITDTGVASLCEALQHPSCKVTTLYLSGNQITDTGVTRLCEALQHPSCKVTTLYLSGNQITDTGVTRLCEALQHPSCKVTTLHLSYNQITDTGVTSLCKALKHSNCKLTSLVLWDIPISEESKESLRTLVQQHRPGFKLDI